MVVNSIINALVSGFFATRPLIEVALAEAKLNAEDPAAVAIFNEFQNLLDPIYLMLSTQLGVTFSSLDPEKMALQERILLPLFDQLPEINQVITAQRNAPGKSGQPVLVKMHGQSLWARSAPNRSIIRLVQNTSAGETFLKCRGPYILLETIVESLATAIKITVPLTDAQLLVFNIFKGAAESILNVARGTNEECKGDVEGISIAGGIITLPLAGRQNGEPLPTPFLLVKNPSLSGLMAGVANNLLDVQESLNDAIAADIPIPLSLTAITTILSKIRELIPTPDGERISVAIEYSRMQLDNGSSQKCSTSNGEAVSISFLAGRVFRESLDPSDTQATCAIEPNVHFLDMGPIENLKLAFTPSSPTRVNLPPVYKVRWAIEGKGTLLSLGVTSDKQGESCEGDCKVFDKGVSVTLTATPSDDSVVESVDGCDGGNTGTCTVTMNSDKMVSFTLANIYSGTYTISAGGTITYDFTGESFTAIGSREKCFNKH